MQLPEAVGQQIGGPKFSQGEGQIKTDGIRTEFLRIFPVDADGLACGIVLAGIASGPTRKQGDDAAVFFCAQHRANGVPVPALCELHRAPHDAGGPQQVFQHLVDIRELLRHLLRSNMVVAQDVADSLLGQLPVIGKAADDTVAADKICHLREGIGEHVVIMRNPLPNLFIKPTHVRTPYSLRISSS